MAVQIYTFKTTYADCDNRIWRTAADAEKTKAEAVKITSESGKIDAETEQIKSSLLSTPTAQQIQDATTNLSEPMNTLQQIAEHNNINISA